jgi:hypothetical protein
MTGLAAQCRSARPSAAGATRNQRADEGRGSPRHRSKAPEPDSALAPDRGRLVPVARDSGQAQFFEPSDWQAARFVAEVMSRNLRQKKFSSVLFARCGRR